MKMMPNGNLVLTSVTVSISGDYFYCQIGWNDHMTTYNATYRIFIDNCETKWYTSLLCFNCLVIEL